MKRLFTSILLLLSTITTYARERSALNIRFTDGREIMVTIDGRRYERHAASLTFGNLPAGWHDLRVYEYIEYANGGGRAKLAYVGSLRVKPGKIAYCVVDAYAKRMRVSVEDKDNAYVDYDANNGVDNNTQQADDFRNNGLKRKDLQDLQALVADRITDTEKLKLMKSTLASKHYGTQDVRIMMDWLNFEASRLDFAKWSYDKVTDPHEYWKIEGDFTYSSSKDNFNNYIKKKDAESR